MQPIHLAFLWHQHQPYYKDILSGRYALPWVRLHSIKSYTGLILVLKEFPEVHATINLVPSLIVQIQEYAEGKAEDHALRLTKRWADTLAEADALYILDHFFVGNPAQVIHPFPRYRELMERRGLNRRTAAEALSDFDTQMLRDLQVWATLAWFHPLVVAADPVLRELRNKGRDFTEVDKAAMLQRQDEIIRRVLPLHRNAAESGQIEISTTPFYHPILPLLCNMESAREALPDLPMPEKRSDFRPDAETQLVRALELHERVFGRRPTGLWPAEGSVSMDILPLLAGRGLRWIASDEAILARSQPVDLSRDHSGVLQRPDDLCQPYALPGGEDMPAIVFRDRALSDAIGFDYHRGDERAGAENLVWRISELGRRCAGRPRLVSIILDGENPWDYYSEAGLVFQRELFGRLARSADIVTTRLSDYIEQHKPEKKLARLHAGSWIDANFGVWIGTDEDRTAWSLTAQAREALLQRIARHPPPDLKTLEVAWEEIYVAEGSDWCWWLGGDRTSDQDYLFDELFRNHLANVYRLIGEVPPAALAKPIAKPPRLPRAQPVEEPQEIVFGDSPDAHLTWRPSGHYIATGDAATMGRSGAVVMHVYYGFAGNNFLLRLDGRNGLRESLGPDVRVAVRFLSPATFSLVSDGLNSPRPALHLIWADGREAREVGSAALRGSLGLACPTWILASRPGDEIEFIVEILRAAEVIQRIPVSGSLRVVMPGR